MERPIHRFLHLIFALGSLHLLVLGGLEARRFVQTQQALQAAQTRVEALEVRVARLGEELDAAQTPAHREAMARRMGYVRKDEVLSPRSE